MAKHNKHGDGMERNLHLMLIQVSKGCPSTYHSTMGTLKVLTKGQAQ
jgi:hypothetical protein